jgi:hypothetical protein
VPAPVRPADVSARSGRAPSDAAQAEGTAAPKPLESLDDYFDRLDAAFSTDAPTPPPAFDGPIAPPPAAPEGHADFGSWDIPFESRQQRTAPEPAREEAPPAPVAAAPALETPPVPPAPAPNEVPAIAPEQTPVAQTPALADAFAALLAAEQKAGAPVSPAPATLDEAAIDEIARRVMARLTTDTVRSTVLDVAERLVREEIERIKQQAKL